MAEYGDSYPRNEEKKGYPNLHINGMSKLGSVDNSHVKTTERNPLEMQDSTIRENNVQQTDIAARLAAIAQ